MAVVFLDIIVVMMMSNFKVTKGMYVSFLFSIVVMGNYSLTNTYLSEAWDSIHAERPAASISSEFLSGHGSNVINHRKMT